MTDIREVSSLFALLSNIRLARAQPVDPVGDNRFRKARIEATLAKLQRYQFSGRSGLPSNKRSADDK